MEPAKAPNAMRQLSPEKTAAILDGAMRVFLEQGYAGTTMDRIAAESGVSKPTVYSHFRDKEGLFNTLIEQLVQKKQWAKCSQDLLQPSEESPEVVLRQLANDFLDNCINNPEQITFIRLIIGESGRFPELGRAFVQHMDKPMLEALTHYLATCPNLNVPDPAVLARTFMGTLIYFIINHEMLHGSDIVPMERDRLVEHLISLIMALHSGANFEREQAKG
ncbi:MAG: TetR/AcrR family transcriptional regulator [Coleofasciculus sp. S288]|nr:TetR/AcrR family transcriptional regulator [Coleofasciculus sp. S288]